MNANISQFLERFQNVLLGEDIIRGQIVLIIKEITGFSLNKEEVCFKGNSLKLKCDTYMKTEVFLRKEKILETLRLKFPNKTIRDII